MGMFWGNRCGTVLDLDGNAWMVGTHIAEPTRQEMKKAMKQPAGPFCWGLRRAASGQWESHF